MKRNIKDLRCEILKHMQKQVKNFRNNHLYDFALLKILLTWLLWCHFRSLWGLPWGSSPWKSNGRWPGQGRGGLLRVEPSQQAGTLVPGSSDDSSQICYCCFRHSLHASPLYPDVSRTAPPNRTLKVTHLKLNTPLPSLWNPFFTFWQIPLPKPVFCARNRRVSQPHFQQVTKDCQFYLWRGGPAVPVVILCPRALHPRPCPERWHTVPPAQLTAGGGEGGRRAPCERYTAESPGHSGFSKCQLNVLLHQQLLSN